MNEIHRDYRKTFLGNQCSTYDSSRDHHYQGSHPCAPQRERRSVKQATGSGTPFARDDKQSEDSIPMPTLARRPSPMSSTIPRDRLQRHSDCDFLMQVKQNADVYLDRIFSNDHRKRETVKKELIQSGVHPSVHVAEVFSSPRTARLVHRFGLTPGLAFDLRTRWDLNDPARPAKMWSHLQQERPILIVGSWSGHSAG